MYRMSLPGSQPFSTNRLHSSRVCSQPGSAVPVSSQILTGGFCSIESTSRQIAKLSHQTDGDITISRRNFPGYKMPIASVTRPPRDEPPKPVNVTAPSPIIPIDKRFQFVHQKTAVQSRQTAAAFLPSAFCFNHSGCGRIFVDPLLAHVRHCDNDERVDNFGANEAFRCFVDTPFDATKGSCCIKYILSVVQIEH